jgi:uncharacterized protein (DUF2252 family)
LDYRCSVHAFDPVQLAKAQLASDRAKTARFPGLFERKIQRMSASPLAFLRGAAPMYYQMLAARPGLAKGPPGEGWLTGDLHLENFGAYRPDHGSYDEHGAHKRDAPIATFNLNDFDDAFIGPWRLDVLRLTTSLILGGRELGADGHRALELSYRLLDAYAASAAGKPPAAPLPRPVDALIEQVRSRTRAALLEGRTELHRGERRLLRGERYHDLPRGIVAKVPAAFARYVATLDPDERPSDDERSILDVALRVAGTGSLGGLRIAVLVHGKGGPDGAWLFDMKEQGAPSATDLLGKKVGAMDPAKRVVTAILSCLEHPPRMIGTTRLGKISMFVRRLSPQEDKLDLTHLRDSDLNAVATYLGTLVGRAHRRGATKKPESRWSQGDCDALVDRAITVAGIHEATYLALCKLTGTRPARR